MTKHSRTCDFERYDVVVVPYPYTENLEKSKKRPAVVLTDMLDFNIKTGRIICAMITSSKSPWPGDVNINNTKKAGLDVRCCIRMKLFTIDANLILRRAGTLDKMDIERFQTTFAHTMGL